MTPPALPTDQQTSPVTEQHIDPGYRSWTLADFDKQTFPVEYIVKDILVALQPCMVLGPPKVLKTTTGVLDLGLSIACRREFLGRFPIEKQLPVAVMTRESGPAVLQETVRRICAAKGIVPSTVTNFHISTELPKLEDPLHHVRIRDFLKSTGAKVLFIDNVYLTMSGDEWSVAAKVGNTLHTTQNSCEEFGATLVYSHHPRKTLSNPNQPLDIQNAAGAGFGEFAGQWLILSRRRNYVLGSGFHELHLVTGSRSGHSGLWAPNISEGTDPQNRKYEVSLNTAEEAKVSAETSGKKQRLLKAMEKIETYLAAHGTCGEVESNICEHGKVAADVLQPAIAELLNVGKIEHCEVQRKKTSYPGFRLCQV